MLNKYNENTITNYQKSILNELEKANVYLYTNEGKDYRCWLKYPDGTERIIRKDTCSILYEKGYIEIIDGISKNYYTYKRSKK